MRKQQRIAIKPEDFTQGQWEELCACAPSIKGLCDCWSKVQGKTYQRIKGAVEAGIWELRGKQADIKLGRYAEPGSRQADREWAEDLQAVIDQLERYIQQAKPVLCVTGWREHGDDDDSVDTRLVSRETDIRSELAKEFDLDPTIEDGDGAIYINTEICFADGQEIADETGRKWRIRFKEVSHV